MQDYGGTITYVPAGAIAYGTCGENLTWVLMEDGTLTISGTGNMTNYNPDNLAPWYEYRSSITSVVINAGATSIGEAAFYLCSNLAKAAHTYRGKQL